MLHNKMDVVTSKEVDIEQHKSVVEFGLQAIKTIKSNSIVVVREVTNGINY